MFKQSLTYNAAKRFFTAVINAVKNSATAAFVLGFFTGFDKLLENSGIYAFFMNGVLADRFYKTSAVYSLIGKLRIKLLSFVEKTVNWSKEKFGTSCLFAILDFLSEKKLLSLDIFLGLFVGAMFIVPNGLWNNLFGVVAAMFFGVWTLIEMSRRKNEEKYRNLTTR